MKHVIALLVIAVAVVAWPRVSAAQEHMANVPTADFHLSKPLVVGAQTLAPGDYKFHCQTIDGREYLVVTLAEDGSEVARVPCKPEPLSAKITMSDFRSITRPDGVVALTAVRIKGEQIAHRVILD